MKSTQEKNSLKNYVVNQSCQGITLLALVVTIVILLILASITISLLLTDTGIFDITNQAKIEHEIAVLRDRIEVIKVGWVTDNFIDPPNITLDDFWNRLVDNNIIRDPKTDVTKIEEGLYELDTTEGYLVEVW
ncbi:MAG: type II secretion system protein, partial [Intestinibacter sp.]